MQETISPVTLTGASGSDVRALTVAVNKLIRQVSGCMMPGCLLTDPATKKGTSSEKTWRAEAFSFTFRGLHVSAAAQEKAFTATTHDVAASKEAWYVLSTQSNGTSFTITKAADQTIGTKVLPTTPDNEVAIAWLKIVTNAGGILTPRRTIWRSAEMSMKSSLSMRPISS